MKKCPQCASIRINRSHAKSWFESFLRAGLGYHFYRCKECNWRGRARPQTNQVGAKLSIGTRLGLYALAAMIVLFVVFVVVGTGGSTPPPQQ